MRGNAVDQSTDEGMFDEKGDSLRDQKINRGDTKGDDEMENYAQRRSSPAARYGMVTPHPSCRDSLPNTLNGDAEVIRKEYRSLEPIEHPYR